MPGNNQFDQRSYGINTNRTAPMTVTASRSPRGR